MADALSDLEDVLRARFDERPAGSYSASLFDDPERLQRKIMEEAFEVCLELGRHTADRARIAEEAADLVFHLMAGLVSRGVRFGDVATTLEARKR